jgi:Family of unknown function (DUF5906)
VIGATGPQDGAPLSQTELEIQEAQRLAAKRQVQFGRPANTAAPATVVPLRLPSNDNKAPKKPNGHFDADVAKAHARTNVAAEEPARQLSGQAQTPSSFATLAPAPMPHVEVKHDTQPPQQTTEAQPPQGKPIPIRPDFAGIPEELKALPNWVMWKYMPPKANGQKWRKVPCRPDGRTAITTDRSTWRPFDECCAAYVGGGFDGVGFVFDGKVGPDGLCYVGVDFDACIEDGKLHPLAASRIKPLNTHTETSVSGTGIHCIARAKPLDHSVKSAGVEIYSDKRYFTFTGCTLPEFKQIRDATAEINALIEQVRPKELATKQQGGRTSKRDTTILFDATGGADAAFGDPTDESLSDGIKSPSWFEVLSPERKDQAVDYALRIIAAKTSFLETEADGGNNDMWYRLTTAVAVSGAPHAEDIFVKHALAAKNADPEDELRQHFLRCQARADGRITVGTLLGLAAENGADFNKWKSRTVSNPVLEQMNLEFAAGFIASKFRIARFSQNQRYPLQREVEFITQTDFINGVINPMVQTPKFDKSGKPGGTKMTGRGAYWLDLPERSEYDAVTFQPGAPPIIVVERADRIHRTINTYSGFSVVPDHVDSANKCAKYLAHVHDNVAAGDETLYKYILDWMASGVQHPDHPGRSSLSMRGPPGCGKGVFALGYGRLFGKHLLHATHRDHVIGRFNAHQAETCLIFVDEALYAEIAGDAQVLKTMTSETTKVLERKGIDAIQIDNFARQIFATNAEHPIQIEHDDRRYPAIYVREDKSFADEPEQQRKANKRKAYFMPILDELKNGGSEALLGFLLDHDIRDFNAEAIPETAERRQQKLNSAPADDQIIIGFAQDGCLPAALSERPWIARAHPEGWLSKGQQTPGLYEAMKTRGGSKLARMSDVALAKILKGWGFKSKSLGDSRGWEAPPLLDLRKAILAKYPAVEFDDRSEWVQDRNECMLALQVGSAGGVAKDPRSRTDKIEERPALPPSLKAPNPD